MPAARLLHPTPHQLQGYAQGRLSSGEMAEIEAHLAACDSCCQHLQQLPDDTLVQLAREAATFSFRSDESRPAPARLPQPKSPSAKSPSAKSPPPDIPPELLDNPRYRVLGLVGLGGMGAVYKAEHRLMKRLVALKVISPAFMRNAAAADRFLREFRSTAMLSHPNVVTAYDADQAGDLHFFVMEFVEGLPLDRLVAQRGRLPIPQACRLIRQAALGLQHIHEKRLVHRDIKPQNLMVDVRTRDGQLKILDCGLARSALDQSVERPDVNSPPAADPHATVAGMILGTPDYIAPEQFADARLADIRSDIYSLGCTLYFALAGQPPFPHGTVVEKLNAHSSATPAPIATLRPDVPPELARILERMMAKDPASRHQTPGDVARDLAPLDDESLPKDNSTPPVAAPVATPAINIAPLLSGWVDPLADLSLGEIGNLPPLQRTKSRPGFRFGPPHLVAALLACGTALALVMLAFPLSNYLWPQPQRAVAGNKASGSKQGNVVPIAIPPIAQPPAPQPVSIPAPGVAQSLPRKVLLVIPRYGLWYPDFGNVKDALDDENIEFVVASSSVEPSSLHADSVPGVAMPDIILDAPLDAGQFGAIIFVGYDTSAYHPDGKSGNRVGRIIDDFRDRGRLVTAICTGQRVLAAHGELRDKEVAYSSFSETAGAYANCGARLVHMPVQRDGQLITAAADTDAKAFVAEIVAALGGH